MGGSSGQLRRMRDNPWQAAGNVQCAVREWTCESSWTDSCVLCYTSNDSRYRPVRSVGGVDVHRSCECGSACNSERAEV